MAWVSEMFTSIDVSAGSPARGSTLMRFSFEPQTLCAWREGVLGQIRPVLGCLPLFTILDVMGPA
jgi:hypothetical protein